MLSECKVRVVIPYKRNSGYLTMHCKSTSSVALRLECLRLEGWGLVLSKSYQRLLKRYLMPRCLALSIKGWTRSKSLRHTRVMFSWCTYIKLSYTKEAGDWLLFYGPPWPPKPYLL